MNDALNYCSCQVYKSENDKEKPLNISLDVLYGHVEIRSWIEFDGRKYIGMGSKSTYDKDGKITDFKIEPTGLTMSYS